MRGSHARYERRKRLWKDKGVSLPLVRHYLWWLVHNCVSHPTLGLLPLRPMVWFHDWTAKHLNVRDKIRPSKAPEIPSRWRWFWHNCVGHLAIGLVPCETTFKFHDRTSREMAVKYWV